MKASDWKQAESLLSDSVQLAPGQRGSFLQQAAADGRVSLPDLLEVCVALAHEHSARTPTLDWDSGEAQESPVLPQPAGLDAFELIEELGAGGMGVVYRARQRGRIEREVALKLCPPGLSSSLRQRLLQERRLLARLNHPQIARMLEAGESEAGQPYFVMELVAGGLPISQWCDLHRIDVAGRLQLFISLCGAVQYTHQQGVVHRDLKPGNVLVGGTVEDPQLRIIDFGIARALAEVEEQVPEPDAAPASGLTGLAVIGTPDYMGPERLQPGAAAVDGRTDLYSLGVMLHELLLGEVPLRHRSGESLGQWRSRLRDQGPVELVQRFRALAPDQQRAVARARNTTPVGLLRWLGGDVLALLRRCLAASLAARYGSAAELAEDLQRLLEQRPLRAIAPTRRYLLARFLQRNRAWVWLAGLLLAGLLLALWWRGVQLQQARAATLAASQARQDSEQAVTFLSRLFVEADPAENLGQPLDAVALLQRGVARLADADPPLSPLARARILNEVAQVIWRRGDADAALPLAREAQALHQTHAPADKALQAADLHLVGTLYSEVGDYEQAESMLQQAVLLREQALGPAAPLTLNSLNNLAICAEETARYERALELYRQIETRLLANGQSDDLAMARTQNVMAVPLRRLQRLDEAEAALQRSLALYRAQLDPRHPSVSLVLLNLGDVKRDQGQLAQARQLLEEAAAQVRDVQGPSHPDLARLLNALGNVEKAAGRWAVAEAHFRRAESIYGDHWTALYPRGNRFLIDYERGDRRAVLQATAAFVERLPVDLPDPLIAADAWCVRVWADPTDPAAARWLATAERILAQTPDRSWVAGRCLQARWLLAEQRGDDEELAQVQARWQALAAQNSGELGRWLRTEWLLRVSRSAPLTDEASAELRALLAILPPDHRLHRSLPAHLSSDPAQP